MVLDFVMWLPHRPVGYHLIGPFLALSLSRSLSRSRSLALSLSRTLAFSLSRSLAFSLSRLPALALSRHVHQQLHHARCEMRDAGWQGFNHYSTDFMESLYIVGNPISECNATASKRVRDADEARRAHGERVSRRAGEGGGGRTVIASASTRS